MAVIRVSRLWGSPDRPAITAVRSVAESDGLDAFGSEVQLPATESPTSSTTVEGRSSSTVSTAWKGPLLLVAVACLAGAATWQYQARLASSTPGSLTIQTTTPGLEVAVGGTSAGRTPLTVSLAPGTYKVLIGAGTQQREIDVAISAGATIQHVLDIAPAPPVTALTVGSLQVQTDVPSMTVVVDGVERGVSPLTIPDLAPGEHQVVVRADDRTIRRTVAVKAGETVALVLSSIGPVTTSPGWLSVTAPVVMQLRENGQLIGSTEAEKLMLATGDHEIEIVNDDLGFKASRRITVKAGKVAMVAIELPQGSLSINALPWAEVWVDGERIGETPIANLNARLGQREVLFRHPQLGERRETVMVTLKQPARLGVDLRRPQP